jgi:hypothetical protein
MQHVAMSVGVGVRTTPTSAHVPAITGTPNRNGVTSKLCPRHTSLRQWH